jgi:hypothetical protein
MHFLPPINAGSSVEDLKNKSFEIIKEYYIQNNHQ